MTFRTLHLAAAAALAALVPSVAAPAQTPPAPWTISPAKVDRADSIKILVLYDMEGLSGVDNPTSFLFGDPDYPEAQNRLVADVNAVVDGLFKGGATAVDVVDAHGSGNQAPDLSPDRLDPRAVFVRRDTSFDPYIALSKAGAYDAVAVVGMHAKNGSLGFAAHTYTIGVDLSLDGRNITETEIVALSFGEVGIPVIFAAGDDKLRKDLSGMPWLHYVEVKQSTDARTAKLVPVEAVHKAMVEEAAAAVRGLESAKLMKLDAPAEVTVKAIPPANLAVLEGFPGIDYRDNSVTFRADNFHDAYRGAMPIIRVLAMSLRDPTFSALRTMPGGAEIMAAGQRQLVKDWMDAESGRPPAPLAPRPPRTEYGVH
ncbi:M55 family metallopeptidase [Sphingosinicella rhizophila]|uniref:M55 family metallopeptidase n=1 Tax=Sphingosinicella rhizophila TaxID=3050082 RepID=A0ABU3QAD2_9SPHN|nr:M55 family metallopeptidase [Sphingosinicella sp. GR2756]MDT9600282.1 M55 family metallopeptidase [Sphingosinicella sp. GR2756]